MDKPEESSSSTENEDSKPDPLMIFKGGTLYIVGETTIEVDQGALNAFPRPFPRIH